MTIKDERAEKTTALAQQLLQLSQKERNEWACRQGRLGRDVMVYDVVIEMARIKDKT